MRFFLVAFLCFISLSLFAQKSRPNLSKITDQTIWKMYNRSAAAVTENRITTLSLDERKDYGMAIYQGMEFENGIIELDLKGKDVLQRSFVGVAFHIQDIKTFNAIYFRPFNFRKPERSRHSVQYICHPKYTWKKLRTDYPEQYENKLKPVPDPEDFFHVKIIVEWPTVKVFVENSKEPSLELKMKSEFKKGKIGLWSGNGSDASFKNLVIRKIK